MNIQTYKFSVTATEPYLRKRHVGSNALVNRFGVVFNALAVLPLCFLCGTMYGMAWFCMVLYCTHIYDGYISKNLRAGILRDKLKSAQ